jgi:hypothetical protein
MTLNKVVIDLGKSDFVRGLSYVAISRVRTIANLAFRSQIPEERLKKLGRLNKVVLDFQRREGLPFHDGPSREELGYYFNNRNM